MPGNLEAAQAALPDGTVRPVMLEHRSPLAALPLDLGQGADLYDCGEGSSPAFEMSTSMRSTWRMVASMPIRSVASKCSR
ncbi:hypothetical protein ACH4E5_41670 [Streptomyces afghaniensis]|uniref:hypothetical protein n=1 Tax=Streptomyces afghaniensis TaxID=66865 RepID=UPI0037BD574D